MIREFDKNRHEPKNIPSYERMTTILIPDQHVVSICVFSTTARRRKVTILPNRMNKDHLGVLDFVLRVCSEDVCMLLLGALLADRRQLDLSFEATKLANQVSRER